MKKVMVEFPVVGYAEVVIEVEDDMTADEILEHIEDGNIEVPYDGHSHAESLTPLMDISEARMQRDIPLAIAVVE